MSGCISFFETCDRYDAVVSVDAAYHFPDKRRFFKDCAQLLAATGGRLAVSDVVLREGARVPAWLRFALACCNVPARELMTRREYSLALEQCGFSEARLESEPSALERWPLGARAAQYLEYCVISAKARRAVAAAPRRKVAVIGGGLSGLSAAHALSAEHDVTIFEKADCVGFASHSVPLSSGVVDVPLRMIGEGYYTELGKLCVRVGVRTVPAKVDCSFVVRENVVLRYSSSRLRNMLELAPHAREAYRLDAQLRCVTRDEDALSWGEWLQSRKLDCADRETCPCVAALDARNSGSQLLSIGAIFAQSPYT